MKFTPQAWRWRRKHLCDKLEVLWDDSSLGWCRDYICQWLTRAEIKKKKRSRRDLLPGLNFSWKQLYPWLPLSLRRIRAPADEKLFLYLREKSHRQWLIFTGGDKPTLTKNALNLCVMAPRFMRSAPEWVKSRETAFCIFLTETLQNPFEDVLFRFHHWQLSFSTHWRRMPWVMKNIWSACLFFIGDAFLGGGDDGRGLSCEWQNKTELGN